MPKTLDNPDRGSGDVKAEYLSKFKVLNVDYEVAELRLYERFRDRYDAVLGSRKALIRASDARHMTRVMEADRLQEEAVDGFGLADAGKLADLFNRTAEALKNFDMQHFAEVARLLSRAEANAPQHASQHPLAVAYKTECIDVLTGPGGYADQYLADLMELNNRHGLAAVNPLLAPKDE